jgi:hypothetical protein
MNACNPEVRVSIHKYNFCEIYCDFDSYDQLNSVSYYLERHGFDYDKMEYTIHIPLKKIRQNYSLGERIAAFLESEEITVKRSVVFSTSPSILSRRVTSFLDEAENLNDFIADFVTQTELGDIYGKSAIAVGKGLIKAGLKDPENKLPTALAHENLMVILMPLEKTSVPNVKWCLSTTCHALDGLGWQREVQDFDYLC